MLLAIDVGNTNVVFALFDASLPGDAARQPQGRWRIATRAPRTWRRAIAVNALFRPIFKTALALFRRLTER